MNTNYRIIVVDDDATARLLIGAALGKDYAVEVFESAEDCLMAEDVPDLYLLDVGLPGLDGYELCRRIKENTLTAHVPVMFLSGHDASEDILSGYNAGGQDYIVKPVEIATLIRKIENLRRIALERRTLAEQAQASDELVSLVLANLDEYAVLIKFLRSLNECETPDDIAEAVLGVLTCARLDGAVQIRLRDCEKTYSQSGEDWPLEVAVINHIRTLDRIFEFKRRAAYNFEHITLLVTNMPTGDVELCGRIRDNLAVAAESANAKLAALQSFTDNLRMREEIRELLAQVRGTVVDFLERYDNACYEGSLCKSKLLGDIRTSFARLGMTEQQEEEIMNLVQERTEQLVSLYDMTGQTQVALNSLGTRLGTILETTQRQTA